MVRGHYVQLRCHLPLCHDFSQLNIKQALAHHPIIQNEVNELLTKGTIEQSAGGAFLHSNIFVVPKHNGGSLPILNLKQFNCYMHISTVKVPSIRQVQQLYLTWQLCFFC